MQRAGMFLIYVFFGFLSYRFVQSYGESISKDIVIYLLIVSLLINLTFLGLLSLNRIIPSNYDRLSKRLTKKHMDYVIGFVDFVRREHADKMPT